MHDGGLACVQEWKHRNPDAKRPAFEDAKEIVRGLFAGANLNPIPRRGWTIGSSWPGIREIFGDGRAEEALRNWIGTSKADIDYWQALHAVAAQLLRDHEKFPHILADWLADVLEGVRRKPKVPSGKPWYANNSRDLWICYALELLVALGMTATRNAASPPESACDAVGEVVNISHSEIVSIWYGSAPSQRLPRPWETWDKKLHSGKKNP